MSVSIDIDNFQNWSEIFQEIKRQENLRIFAAIEPPKANDNQGRKKSCFSKKGANVAQTRRTEGRRPKRRRKQK